MPKPDAVTIYGVSVSGDESVVTIGRPNGFTFPRRDAVRLRDWLTEWLDHDPEKELKRRVEDILLVNDTPSWRETAAEIIALVRKYNGKEG